MKGVVLRQKMKFNEGNNRKLPRNFKFFKNENNQDTEENELISQREKTEITAFMEAENLEDGRETKASYDNFKMVESHLALNTLISIGLVIMQYDLEFYEEDKDLSNVLLYMIFVSTLFQLVLTVLRYERKLEFYILRRTYASGSTLWGSGEWKLMLLEMLFFAIHPSPFLYGIKVYHFENEFLNYPIYYHLNDFFGIVVILRVIFVFRALSKYTYWTSNRSQRLCQLYDSQATITFAMKCYVREYPFIVAFGLYLTSIPILAFFLRVFELPNIRTDEVVLVWSFEKFYDAMWDIVITIGTIGFGDYSPQTLCGRIFTFFVCIWGSSVTSLIVVATNQKFEMTNIEGKIYRLLKRLRVREGMKRESAYIMTNFAKMKFARNANLPTKKNQQKIYNHLQRFRIQNRAYKELSEVSDAERISEQIGWLRSEMSDLIYLTKQLKIGSKLFMNVMGVDIGVADRMGSDAGFVKNSFRSSLVKFSPSFCGGGRPEFDPKEKQIPF